MGELTCLQATREFQRPLCYTHTLHRHHSSLTNTYKRLYVFVCVCMTLSVLIYSILCHVEDEGPDFEIRI